MKQGNIESFETAHFRARLEKAAATRAVGDADFADAIYTAVSAFGITEDKFRAAFGLSEGTVERWTRMKNLPQPSARSAILGWILAQI